MDMLFSSLEIDSYSWHLKQMKHEIVYEALIQKALRRDRPNGYLEKHHIKPKALFPDLKDDPCNIVLLTAREHFVAHLLLAKIHGGSMSFAANSMSLNGRYGGRTYAWLREEAAAHLSNSRKGDGNPMFGRKAKRESTERRIASMLANRGNNPSPLKGRVYTDEEKKRRPPALKGEAHPSFGRRHSENSKRRMSEALKGRVSHSKGVPLSAERRRHLSEINTGRKRLQEEKDRISASLKGRPKPPRSEEHKRNLAEANRINAEKGRLYRMENPVPSRSMLQIFEILKGRNDLSCSQIADLSEYKASSLLDSLKKMEALGWVSVSWRRPVSARSGRGSGRGMRRFYILTPEGIVFLSKTVRA